MRSIVISSAREIDLLGPGRSPVVGFRRVFSLADPVDEFLDVAFMAFGEVRLDPAQDLAVVEAIAFEALACKVVEQTFTLDIFNPLVKRCFDAGITGPLGHEAVAFASEWR